MQNEYPDIGKSQTYDFHYNNIKPKYGDTGRAKLLLKDADSLYDGIETEDYFKDISGDVEDKFVTSNYPIVHCSGISSCYNKKVVGMMKYEASGKISVGFAGLRPKLYSLKMHKGKEE